MDRVDDLHPVIRDFAEWTKAHAVKKIVVPVIDEQLGRARVGSGCSERNAASGIRLLNRIVIDFCARRTKPGRIDFWIAMDSPLHDKSPRPLSWGNAEKPISIIKFIPDPL